MQEHLFSYLGSLAKGMPAYLADDDLYHFSLFVSESESESESASESVSARVRLFHLPLINYSALGQPS